MKRLLSLVLLVLILGSVVLFLQDRQTVQMGVGRLFPSFVDVVSGVDRIDIQYPGGQVQLEQKHSQWVVTNKTGYPAKPGNVGKLLLSLAQAEVIEHKTSNPALYHKLSVNDPAEDDGGVRVQVFVDGAQQCDLIIGNKRNGTGFGVDAEYYVRKTESPQSVLVRAELDVPEHPLDWLDDRLLLVEGDEIARLSANYAVQDFVVERSSVDDEFKLVDGTDGQDIDLEQVQQFAGWMNTIRFSDVMAIQDTPVHVNDKELWRIEIRTFLQQEMKLRMFVRDDQYIAIVSGFTEKADDNLDEGQLNRRQRVNDWFSRWEGRAFVFDHDPAGQLTDTVADSPGLSE